MKKINFKLTSKFLKKLFNIYCIILVVSFLIHEIIDNRRILERDVFFSKDYHNIASSFIDISLISYTGFLIKDYLFLTNNFAISMTLTLASAELIKRVIQKERPDKSDAKSFPSGHTAIAFVCFFWFFIYKNKKNITLLFPAIFVGILRILAIKHDIYDVSAGAILSLFICFLCLKLSLLLKDNNSYQRYKSLIYRD